MNVFDKWTGRGRAKPYAIIAKAGETAEVNLNGEIVQSVPFDPWTGEEAKGLFIVLQKFLEDMDALKDAREVTFRINSVGGEVEAGIQIYNRIRELPGKTVTVVEGLAASAASIVAQAGDVRRMAEGSQIMVHGVSGFLFGYYNRDALMKETHALEKLDESLAGIYAARSGMDKQAALRMMRKETWMTAKDALEANLADEVAEGVFPVIGVVPGSPGCVSVGGVRHPLMGLPMPREAFHSPREAWAAGLFALPKAAWDGTIGRAPDDGAAPGDTGREDEANAGKGGKAMDLRELKAKHPELAEQIREEEKAAAAAKADEAARRERERIRKIDEVAASVGDASLVKRAKYEEPMSAQELAFAALKAQEARGEKFLDDLRDDLPLAASLPQAPNGGMESEAMREEAALNALLEKISQKGGK